MSRYNAETRWVKFVTVKDFIVLANDVIAMASGIDILFINLTTGEEIIEKFDSPERGKGVSCLAGHSVVPMFATAEKRSSPKIFIFTHPGIQKVSNCILEQNPNGYLSCIFAGSDYLLTLTSFPNFRINLWSWRTGENLTSIDTMINDHQQRLICSPSSPCLVSQLGKISGKLVVYEINVCSSTLMISPINENCKSTMNRILCTSWSKDGNLFQCDLNGNVTLNFNDGKRCHLIVQGNDKDMLNFKTSPLIEFYRSGIIVVNRESRISFYKKPTISGCHVKPASPWKLAWSIQATSHPLITAKLSSRESLLFYCKGGEIFELIVNVENDLPEFHRITQPGNKYEFIVSVNPRNDQIVAIDEFHRLSIFQSHTGRLMSYMCLRTYGNVRCIVSHPCLPLISIGTSNGKFLLLSFVKISQPSILKVIHLQRESLETIRYSWSADLLGVGDANREKLFIICSGKSDEYNVISLLNLRVKIVDFLIYESSEKTMKVLVLAKTRKSRNVGEKIVIYSVDNSSHEEECLCIIELTNMLDSLYYGRSRCEIIVIPYLTKQLHCMKIQEDFRGLTLREALTSGHQLRNTKLSMNDSFVVTFGYDGLVIVRKRSNIKQVVAIFMSQHRLDGGCKMAIVTCVNTIVSLGKNGNLAATKFCSLKSVESIKDIDVPVLRLLQSVEDIEHDLTWVERKDKMNLQREREEYAGERYDVFRDFSKLREKIKVLLDANEHESIEAKFLISDFDIDVDLRARRINENIEEEKRLIEKLKFEIFQRDELTKYLRKLCWDSMEIQACSLLSINGKVKIDNFPIPKISEDEKNRRKWENLMVDIQGLVGSGNHKNEICKRFDIEGTTTCQFLPELSDRAINQIRKSSSFMENLTKNTIIKDRERKLKIHFNVLFEDMRSAKNQVLTMAAQRHREIEHCALELKNMFNVNAVIDKTLSQPLWPCSEIPETILTIEASEIIKESIATYPKADDSLEIIRKREEQEEECPKLEESFREKTLEIMMDGLLEVRWEDEIRKEPPKPSCLTTKDPSTYTEEEISEWEMYRIKCEAILRDRKKYKKMLEDKIVEVEDALRNDFGSFDRRLEVFHLYRMKLESAILQETLMRLRESQRHLLRRRGIESIKLAREKLELSIKDSKKMDDTSMFLENHVTEMKNRYEILVKRNKTLDGKFRGEFEDLKQPIVEHLSRHYRKRPRNVQLTCTSITYLKEIGRCIATYEKSEILPKDCLDFLQGMDSLDAMPNNLPAQIDTRHWNLLCKLRRAKVELEIKIKICAVDLTEAEQTLASHQKSCAFMENKVLRLKEIMNERELLFRETLEDMQVQLVLKMDQIECQLYGNTNELKNAILVPFSIVQSANSAIIEAGHQKLASMKQTIIFRRKIMWQEWCHKCMQITLDNMREDLKGLQSVKVTREMQNYLHIDSFDFGVEKNMKSHDLVLASTQKRFSRILKEKSEEFNDKIRKISSWREKNRRALDSVEKMKLASFKTSLAVYDDKRERDARHRKIKLRMIMKKTRLKKKVQENCRELLALQTQLELLRLKTYPTLKIKGPPRLRRIMKKFSDD